MQSHSDTSSFISRKLCINVGKDGYGKPLELRISSKGLEERWTWLAGTRTKEKYVLVPSKRLYVWCSDDGCGIEKGGLDVIRSVIASDVSKDAAAATRLSGTQMSQSWTIHRAPDQLDESNGMSKPLRD